MRKEIRYLCLILLNLAFIWGNSAMPASVSGEISGGVFAYVEGFFAVFGSAGEYVLRKLGHLSEFALLGFLLTGLTLCRRKGFDAFALPLLGGILTACMDETIQLFSPGRSSSLVDVWIDAAGACTGIALMHLLKILLERRKTERKKC